MEKIATALLAALLLGSISLSCRTGEDTFPHAVIVHASELACRKNPSTGAPVIRYFHFGTPLVVTARSQEKTHIGAVEDHWYREKESGGWVFGGFLFHSKGTEPSARFESQRIRCNVICGGLSCFYEFSALIAGDYYVSEVFIADYPQPKEPALAIVIGKCAVKDGTIHFEDPLKIAGYDYEGNHLSGFSMGAGQWPMKGLAQAYEKRRDNEGEFFVGKGAAQIPARKALREKCASKDNKEEIWIDIKVFHRESIVNLQKLFPLLKKK